jgi:hypothetical protein
MNSKSLWKTQLAFGAQNLGRYWTYRFHEPVGMTPEDVHMPAPEQRGATPEQVMCLAS